MAKIKALNGETSVWSHKMNKMFVFTNGIADIPTNIVEEMKDKGYVSDGATKSYTPSQQTGNLKDTTM